MWWAGEDPGNDGRLWGEVLACDLVRQAGLAP
jgi:hypothetical protein